MPFVLVGPTSRACVRGERGDMPFVLVFTTHPVVEVPFVSMASVFRAGAVWFRVGGGDN